MSTTTWIIIGGGIGLTALAVVIAVVAIDFARARRHLDSHAE